MPKRRPDEAWEEVLRTAARSSTAKGWILREHRGRARLELRSAGQFKSVGLPFSWASSEVAAILARVRNIYLLSLKGHGLQDAASIAEGRAPQRQVSWCDAVANLRRQKLEHGSAIKPTTWDQHYTPVLELAVQLLEGPRQPADAAGLLEACLRGWAPGSRARQIRAQSLAQFLRHCVEREKFPDSWRPPLDLRPHWASPGLQDSLSTVATNSTD